MGCEFLLASLREGFGVGLRGEKIKIRENGRGWGGVGTKSMRKLCRNYPLAIYPLVSPRLISVEWSNHELGLSLKQFGNHFVAHGTIRAHICYILIVLCLQFQLQLLILSNSWLFDTVCEGLISKFCPFRNLSPYNLILRILFIVLNAARTFRYSYMTLILGNYPSTNQYHLRINQEYFVCAHQT